MWGAKIDPTQPFIYAIFGIQHSNPPSPSQTTLISALTSLITPHATYIDTATQVSTPPHTHQTHILLTYWLGTPEYQEWWTSTPVTKFWSSLPEDAGIYREVLTVSPKRTQLGLSQPKLEGMSNLGSVVERRDASGYWGCYRDRYVESKEKEGEKFKSSLEAPPIPSTRMDANGSGEEGEGRRLGRVLISKFPDNLCFVVEGQDHGKVEDKEKAHWFENFDASVGQWMRDLNDAGPEAGILDKRFCFVEGSGKYVPPASAVTNGCPRVSSGDELGLSYNRKIQLFYFLDHGYMEKIGVRNKGHVSLRNRFLGSYKPDGEMGKEEGGPKLGLWVETSVLKETDIEAEYVGCYDGTGFLAYDREPAFGGK